MSRKGGSRLLVGHRSPRPKGASTKALLVPVAMLSEWGAKLAVATMYAREVTAAKAVPDLMHGPKIRASGAVAQQLVRHEY